MATAEQANRTGLLVGASLLASLLLVMLLAWGVSTGADPGDDSRQVEGLNTVVVLVDDMDDFTCADADEYLPRSSRWLRDRGTCFENATVTDPVCCPARGTLTTGQMPHNNGVIRQIDADELRVEDTIQRALGEAGLLTYGTGKYINGVKAQRYYAGDYDPGFQQHQFWNNSSYYGYQLIDKTGELYTPPDRLHSTVRTGRNLRDFIERAGDRQFYAYAGFFAPHTQRSTGRPESRWPIATTKNRGRKVPRLKQRVERDTSDKLPLFRQQLPPRSFYEKFHQRRVQALYDVDDEVAMTFEQLEKQGIADHTAVIFASDNGLAMGSNGWDNKGVAYPSSIRVPLLAYLPGTFEAGAVDKRQVGLVDVAPTLYELYGLEPGHVLDGRSLLSDVSRKEQYFEFENERSDFVLKESGSSAFRIPTWAMYTRGVRAYLEYYAADGSLIAREFYADPLRRHNLLSAQYSDRRPPARTVREFRRRLHQLQRCEGTAEQGSENPCP